jgi:hypothetical protein
MHIIRTIIEYENSLGHLIMNTCRKIHTIVGIVTVNPDALVIFSIAPVKRVHEGGHSTCAPLHQDHGEKSQAICMHTICM